MTITATARHSTSFASEIRFEAFEALEDRRLLSASGLSNSIVSLDWNGHRANAEAGEYILAVNPTARMVNGRAAGRQMAAVQAALSSKVQGLRISEYLGQPGQFLVEAPQG